MEATIDLIREKMAVREATWEDQEYLKKLRTEFFKELALATEIKTEREGGIEL
jgi:hypothetical protein